MYTVKRGLVAMAMVVGMIGVAKSASAEPEEPEYDVLDTREGFEVRLYKRQIVAETTTTGTPREAANKGFRILAGYIFGDNKAARRMQMTAPVTTRTGEKMKMTAPVTLEKGADDAHVMRFMMERKYTMATLPEPNDLRVRLIEIPERTVAVLRYSGRTSDARFEKQSAVLLRRLDAAKLEPIATPVKAIYNGPWTPSFMRRNEVQVEIEWDSK